jgi:hypothetical protein
MKLIIIVLTSCLLAPAFGQTGVIAQDNVLKKDFTFYWQCRLEPPSPPLSNNLGYASGTNEKDGNIYRVMIDRAHRTYFGYEVRIEPLSQRNAYKMTFHPLDLGPETFGRIHIDDPGTWKKSEIGPPVSKPLYPFRDAADTVHTLDVIAVDLMMNQETGQKIVDYVVLQEPGRAWSFDMPMRREFSYTPGAARDFSVEDASLRIVEPRLIMNDKSDDLTPDFRGDFSGPIIWVYVQNYGRYLLSLAPQPGFRKGGEVRGTSLSFAWGADKFTIGSAWQIAPGDAPFVLYVKNEPAWKPPYANAARVMFGSASRAELR